MLQQQKAGMMIELEFEIQKDYLHVLASGQWELKAAEASLTRIYNMAAANCMTRILIDCTALSPPAYEIDRYYTGEALARIFKHPYKTAAVLRAEMINHFVENVAVNRGASFFVSHDHDAAIEWLVS